MSIDYQSAVIFVRDLAASRYFYEELLGQQVDMDFGPNVGFKGGLALWQVDHAFQMVYGHSPEPGGPLGQRNFELYFEATELETVASRLRENGVEFVQPLHEQPWAQRVFHVYDPDGHIIEVGEPMPSVILRLLGNGLSAQAIADRTGMPLEFVNQLAHTPQNAGEGDRHDDEAE